MLRDVEGQNSYILAVFKGTGYAILTRVNGVIVIFDLESNNIPYDNTPEEATNIFGGPFNYYVDLGNGQMEDLDSQEIVDIETVSTEIIETNQRMINSESIQSASNSLRVLSTRGAVTGIDSSRFARYNSGKWINSTSNYPASAGYPYKDHWVTAYRYQDNGSATSYYWAVDNRGSYTAVINVGWTAGVVGMFR